MFLLDSDKTQVTLSDVAAYFSEDEWKRLNEWQKKLYRNVMNEIHQALMSLGPLIATSVCSLRTKEAEDPCLADMQHSERSHGAKHSPGIPLHKADVHLKKEGECVGFLDDHHSERGAQYQLTQGTVSNDVVSVVIKEEVEAFDYEGYRKQSAPMTTEPDLVIRLGFSQSGEHMEEANIKEEPRPEETIDNEAVLCSSSYTVSQRKASFSAAEESGSPTSMYSPSISILLPPSATTIKSSTAPGVSGTLTHTLVDEESYCPTPLYPPFLISVVAPRDAVTTAFTAPTEGVVTTSPPVSAMHTTHVPALNEPPVMSAAAHPPLFTVSSASLTVPASPIVWVSKPVPAPKKPQLRHRTSEAWKYYDVPENTSRTSSTHVRCRLCYKIVPRGPGGGTTSMYKHLFRHHWLGSSSVSSDFRRQHLRMRQRMCPNRKDTGDEEISVSMSALVSQSSGDVDLGGENECDEDATGVHLV